MTKSQIDEISDLLLSYSAGDYHVKGEISENFDEIDMIISGINMLGEELRSTNVSKEYFSSIFNSVTDLVIIADNGGNLIDVNQSVSNLTGHAREDLLSGDISMLFTDHRSDLFNQIKQELDSGKNDYIVESTLLTKNSNTIYGLFTCSNIFDRNGEFNGYLISVKDITAQKENEKLILKTILSTQSNEQRRVADDLHDSLGQELSMAQLMLSNFGRFEVEDKEYYNLLELCNDILDNSIHHLREICFDLMPNVLVKGGLELAVDTLVGKLKHLDQIQVDFVSTEHFPRLSNDLEIVTYRIIQEFINNMTKHSDANQLDIHLIESDQEIEVNLRENGQGFDMSILNNIGENRGMSNMKTKILAYNGHYELNSKPGEGTNLCIKFPKK